jgi:flagellar basal body-associated protein FliL
MINENSGKEDILKKIDETVSRFTVLASPIDDIFLINFIFDGLQ